ncbi:unnamed protein product [Phaeothamnion confervicola]
MGISAPTPVQAESLEAILGNRSDAVVHAHTGSGKTLAFLLPVLRQLDPSSSAVQLLVVAPGRELAAQIEDVCGRLVEGTGLRSQKVFGGANVVRQIEKLKKDKPQASSS